MDATDQIRRFQEFFELYYKAQVLDKISKGEMFLVIDFIELGKFDPELAGLLIEQPEETMKAAELAIEGIDPEAKKFHVRIKGLLESCSIKVRDIRSGHINRLVAVQGVVRQKSDVRPQVTAARFECPACGNVMNILQVDSSGFKEPSRCSCGRKGKFHLLSKDLVDAQGIVLEEAAEDLEGGEQPKRINIFLTDDLVSPMSEKRTNPGTKIRINGQIKEVPIFAKSGRQSTRFDLMIEANYIESVEEDYSDIIISEEEERKIRELAEDPQVIQRMVHSVAHTIFGHEQVKEALLLQLVGGVHKIREGGIATRGDMHILLIGDPGSGKSQLLKRIHAIAPKGRYVSGRGASAAGLTASVVRDEFLRGWALEAGALVLANKGICCTTADTEFILETGERMTFGELFEDVQQNSIHPSFRVLGLDEKTLKIRPFGIKQAIRLRNSKRIYNVKTRTGRELSLTEDNEVLMCEDAGIRWKEIQQVKKGEFMAVPKQIKVNAKDEYDESFSYICGLIASDGSIRYTSKQAMTSFYNTNRRLVGIFSDKTGSLGIATSVYAQKKGRISEIRGKMFQSKKEVYKVYNAKKSIARRFIAFGIPSGDKSSKKPLERKMLVYSERTIAAFLRGVFDGDGSIRLNPIEVTITTGIQENAKLFQDLLARLGIVSSVKESTNSWHCDVRGEASCMQFYKMVGTEHEEKRARFEKINGEEVKDRIDVLPNHQRLFKRIIEEKRGRLGKKVYRYFWNYAREKVSPSMSKLKKLNSQVKDQELKRHIDGDILWDKVVSVEEAASEFVYDFTMKETNNFVANGMIMHNCIDEMDKMNVEDRAAMHEALEQQTISISKANIQATLIARTTVLAAANPKFGRFDPSGIIAEQINLPPTLINRFDLIFPIMDLPDRDKDEKLASFLLSMHQNPGAQTAEIETGVLRKYIAYAKQRVEPRLTDEAVSEIKEYYLKMRNTGNEEGTIRSIPISARQLEALVRFAEASARLRLSSEVTREDARRSISLLHYCLSQIGVDPETGKIDIDRISTGISATERSKIITVKEIITELESSLGKIIPISDILRAAAAKGVSEDKVEEAIEKLKRSGDIFEPKKDFIQKL